MDLPATWRALSANERDILLALQADGPASGREIFDAVGGEENHETVQTTNWNLRELEKAGYVHREERDRRTDELKLTGDGAQVVNDFLTCVREA